MPGRWESSQRPLFVRTLWIKGVRHVVLSQDDPLLQRAVQDVSFQLSASTPSSASFSSSASSTSTGSLLDSLSDSEIVGHLHKPQVEANTTGHTQKLVSDRNETKKEDNELKSNSRNRRVSTGSSGLRKRQLYLPVDNPPFQDIPVPNLGTRVEPNPLSDRVMKWLDLSGKSLLEASMDERKADAKPRQSSKTSRSSKNLKKYMRHRSASLNIINAQYDVALTSDMRIEGSRRERDVVHIPKTCEEENSKISRLYEFKRCNSVIPLPILPDRLESTYRPTTTDGVMMSTTTPKTKLHIFVPLIGQGDSFSEESDKFDNFALE